VVNQSPTSDIPLQARAYAARLPVTAQLHTGVIQV